MTFNVPFRAVIFDMDGVLFDSEWYYYHELAVFSDAFDLGVTEEERRRMVGNSSQNFFATIQAWWQGAARLMPSACERSITIGLRRAAWTIGHF